MYSDAVIDREPTRWDCGANDDKSGIRSLVQAIRLLRSGGVNGFGVVAAFHRRRVPPLARLTLLLREMTPDALTAGSTTSMEALGDDEVLQRVARSCGTPPLDLSLDNHPQMLPDGPLIPSVGILLISFLILLVPSLPFT